MSRSRDLRGMRLEQDLGFQIKYRESTSDMNGDREMLPVVTMPSRMTTDELLALPDDDGFDRWLIRGELREKPMTRRNRFHSRLTSRLCHILEDWIDNQPEPRGGVFAGEAGCRLARDPDTTVGIDVVYLNWDQMVKLTNDTTIIDGAPTLAIEILSPTNTVDEIEDKLKLYLESGISLIWVVNPYSRTVTAHQPDCPPELFNLRHELTAPKQLPGFRVLVADLFRVVI